MHLTAFYCTHHGGLHSTAFYCILTGHITVGCILLQRVHFNRWWQPLTLPQWMVGRCNHNNFKIWILRYDNFLPPNAMLLLFLYTFVFMIFWFFASIFSILYGYYSFLIGHNLHKKKSNFQEILVTFLPWKILKQNPWGLFFCNVNSPPTMNGCSRRTFRSRSLSRFYLEFDCVLVVFLH